MEIAHEQVSPEENSVHTALAKEELYLAMQSTQALGFTSAWPNGTTAPSPAPYDSTTQMLVYTRNICQDAQSGDNCHFFIWHLLAPLRWEAVLFYNLKIIEIISLTLMYICLLSNETYSRWHHLYKITWFQTQLIIFLWN